MLTFLVAAYPPHHTYNGSEMPQQDKSVYFIRS